MSRTITRPPPDACEWVSRTGVTHGSLGVSHEVAHASPVPVTIVKHAEVLEGADSDVAEDAEV